MRLTVLVFLIALAAACAPANLKPTEPPDIYRAWWGEMEACVGTERDFDGYRWHVAREPWFRCYGALVNGCWVPPGRIYLGRTAAVTERLVKHEILHVLTRSPFHRAHERCLA